jgi:hypothetical protein
MEGRLIEHEGKHYLIFQQAGVTRAVPVVQADDGSWKPDIESIGGVWSEQKPNAQGGTDCIVHVPCLEVRMDLKQPN